MSAPTQQTPGSSTPAPLRPCDLFSEDIHLLVDGELGVAETVLVEEHLQACPRCLTIAARLESMSSMLKDWDTRTNDIPAPALRLKHAVLTRVKEHSVRRRRESRLVGVLHYATAALVLVAIGSGVLLGLHQLPSDDAPTPVVQVSSEPWPLSVAAERAPEFAPHATSERLAQWQPQGHSERMAAFGPSEGFDPLTAVSDEPEWDRYGDWKRSWRDPRGLDQVGFLVSRIKRLDEFAERVGAPSIAWPGPRIAEPGQRLVTVRALNFLHDRGYLEEWKRWTPEPAQAASTTVTAGSPVRGGKLTDMTAADLLSPLPGIDRELNSLFRRGRLSAFSVPGVQKGVKSKGVSAKKAGPAALLEAWPLKLEMAGGLSSGPMRVAPRSFLDPLKAEANHKLRLREQDDGKGSVVFIVQGTSEPILVPAGQFIDGGFGARVVAETVWLPASAGETPRIVRCRMVQSVALSQPKGHPTLVPHVAGPTIRALLADEASQSEIRAAAERIYKLSQHADYDLFDGWNLLEVYGRETGRRYHQIFRNKLNWKTGRGGFVVRDAGGNLVGLEVLRFRGADAEALLMRLWVGYVVEAVLRHGRLHPQNPALARSKTEVNAALGSPSDELSRAFHRIANHPTIFRTPRGFDDSQGWKVSNAEIVAAGLHMHALQVAGTALLISATSR